MSETVSFNSDLLRERRMGADAFSSAASTTMNLSRAIALRVLFCSSVSQLRRQLLHFLRSFLRRSRNGVLPVLSLLKPKGTTGTLVMAALVALTLRRCTNLRSKAQSEYRRQFWRNMMRCALTYEDWLHAARMLEKEIPKMDESSLYDEELVRDKLQELRLRRQEGSLREIVFCMRTDLMRNLGNMCNPQLHKGRLQVPKLIKDYIDEVSAQLKMVCESDSEEFLLEEKLAFMHETRHAFGRTALLLSGGATLAAFHLGVVKTMVDNKLLPRILSGSSAGSIICAIVATRSKPELESFFEDSLHCLKFFDQMGGIFSVMRRVIRQGAVHEIRQLQRLMRDVTSNMTFQEAYDRTGRVLGVSVCSPRRHEPPRCLNYLTSPHVLIWSAVTASCAFPGLFEAQELMAKDRFGEIVPYHAPVSAGGSEAASASSARLWRDGTLESDLPMMQLKELFNVNHFIVSQANPHIAPWLRVKEIVRSYGGDFAGKLANLAEMEVKHRCSQLLELGFPLGGFAKLFTQDWEGDITVVMPATLAQYSKIIQNPTFMDLQMACNQGRRCTWEKLSAIKANCAIEVALDESVALLNHMRRLNKSTEKAATSPNSNKVMGPAHRRIPSWNYVARENSPIDLFEEDVLAEAAAAATAFRQVIGRKESLLSPKVRGELAAQRRDGCDETESEINSWTRSGGPLMRTASSKRFVNFVQSLDIASVKASQRNAAGESENREFDNRIPLTPNSIMISEGDLLQPERIHNGIVFNVVKKEDYILTPRTGGSEECNVSYPEAVADCDEQIESCSTCSGSEFGDDDDDNNAFDRYVADEGRAMHIVY